MLMGYVFCEPLKTKQAEEVVQTHIDNIYCKFGGSLKILTDNGTEFKNELFDKVAKELGVIHKKYTAPYHPASNGRIEVFHNFLKTCLSKHISQTLEWDQVIPLACAGYNFMPSESSKEAPFLLMFSRDPVLLLNMLLTPTICYMGDSEGILSLEMLKNLYDTIATNIKIARSKRDPKTQDLLALLKAGDTVMIKYHIAGPFDHKYIGDYRAVAIQGQQVELMPSHRGKTKMEHIMHVKYVLPADQLVSCLPNYNKFGNHNKLRLDPKYIPDLGWGSKTHKKT